MGIFSEVGDVELVSLMVVVGIRVVGDSVVDDFMVGVGRYKFGGVCEVVDDGDVSDRVRGGGVEGMGIEGGVVYEE